MWHSSKACNPTAALFDSSLLRYPYHCPYPWPALTCLGTPDESRFLPACVEGGAGEA